MKREPLILSVKNADDDMNEKYQKQHQREIQSLCFKIMTCYKCKGYEQYGIVFINLKDLRWKHYCLSALAR